MSWDDAVEQPKRKGKTAKGAYAQAQEEADATGQPVRVEGVGTTDTPRLEEEEEEEKPSMYEFMRTTTAQLADVRTLAAEIRMGLMQLRQDLNVIIQRTDPRGVLTASGKVEVTPTTSSKKAQPEFPILEKTREKTEAELHKSAQEVLANNKSKKPVVDVPSLDVLNHAALGYVKKHGKGALETRLAQYHVKRVSEVPEEKRHLFLQDIA